MKMLSVDTQGMHHWMKGVVTVGQIGVAFAEVEGRYWEVDTPQRDTDHVQT